MVCCNAADARSPLIKSEPVLLVEVLSPSTERDDRGDKFLAYRKLASLKEYLLVDVDTRRCDLFRLNEDKRWVLYPHERSDTVDLQSLQLQLTPSVLWAELPADPG